ncbi:MAG: hydantoinase/oxoprolinase family protein, partial [bacterium]
MSKSGKAIARIGVDSGGTFTDFVGIENYRIQIVKVPSQPHSPEKAVLEGLAAIKGEVDLVSHGTTVGTNAILLRKGGPACMVVTEGFHYILELGRGERSELYSLSPSKPRPLLGRGEIYEIGLRLSADGEFLSSPSEDEIDLLIRKISQSSAKAIALGILHSAAHPSGEIELAKKLSIDTGLPVYASSSLSAYPREYERFTLASIAAYLAPVLGKYLSDLSENCPFPVALTASSGGLISIEQALENPALCVLSGPAGGAFACLLLRRDRMLSLDMGGTSTDVCLIAGDLPRTREASIDNLPLPLPTIDIHTIGAGGGSIVDFDSGGMLKFGPESAGADPGPACYGNCGPVTLTDIALLAGRILPEKFLGGKMRLFKDESLKAVNAILRPSMTVDELIDGVTELAKVHLTGALRKISVARGIDPAQKGADFTLVPFGGAGALFAVECARELGLKEVVHPRAAGVFSAFGLLTAPVALEIERAILSDIDSAPDLITDLQEELTREIATALKNWDENAKAIFTTTVECRYRGQTHTLDIPLGQGENPRGLKSAFEKSFRSRYSYLHKYATIEAVLIRVRGEIPAL